MSERFSDYIRPVSPVKPPEETTPELALPMGEIVNDIPERQMLGRALRTANSEGWIPDTAIGNVGRLINTNVYVDDNPDDHDDNPLQISSANVLDGKGAIGWRETVYSIFIPPEGVHDPKVMTREYLRVLSGEESGLRGMERVFGDGPGGQAMNRAVTEHLADSLLADSLFYGYIDEVHPDSSSRQGDRNIEDRSMLAVLADKIDISLFINAYFGDTAALEEALPQAFPFADVVTEIAELQPKEGQSREDMIAKYASNLEKRSARHQKLPPKIASMATAHLRP